VIHGRNVVTAAAEDGLYAAAQFTIKGRVTAPLNFFNDFEIATQGPAEKFYLESER